MPTPSNLSAATISRLLARADHPRSVTRKGPAKIRGLRERSMGFDVQRMSDSEVRIDWRTGFSRWCQESRNRLDAVAVTLRSAGYAVTVQEVGSDGFAYLVVTKAAED